MTAPASMLFAPDLTYQKGNPDGVSMLPQRYWLCLSRAGFIHSTIPADSRYFVTSYFFEAENGTTLFLFRGIKINLKKNLYARVDKSN